MKIQASRPAHHTLAALADGVSRLASAIAAGWNVEHDASGRHLFPWMRPLWTSIAFTGFTPTASTLLKYQVVGRTMTLTFDVTGTGTVVGLFTFTIPGGYRSAENVLAGMFAYSDVGTPGTGGAYAVGGSIQLYKNINATAWAAGTTRVQGTISFEVQ